MDDEKFLQHMDQRDAAKDEAEHRARLMKEKEGHEQAMSGLIPETVGKLFNAMASRSPTQMIMALVSTAVKSVSTISNAASFEMGHPELFRRAVHNVPASQTPTPEQGASLSVAEKAPPSPPMQLAA